MSLGPCSERQAQILKNNSDVLLMGGGAGSGKSYLLHLIAANYLD